MTKDAAKLGANGIWLQGIDDGDDVRVDTAVGTEFDSAHGSINLGFVGAGLFNTEYGRAIGIRWFDRLTARQAGAIYTADGHLVQPDRDERGFRRAQSNGPTSSSKPRGVGVDKQVLRGTGCRGYMRITFPGAGGRRSTDGRPRFTAGHSLSSRGTIRIQLALHTLLPVVDGGHVEFESE